MRRGLVHTHLLPLGHRDGFVPRILIETPHIFRPNGSFTVKIPRLNSNLEIRSILEFCYECPNNKNKQILRYIQLNNII